VEATVTTLATKDDIANVKEDIANLRMDMGDNIAKVKYDLSKDIGNSIKWMFVFWIGQFGATMAIMLLLLKNR
jgi:hypothetical protein